MTNAPSEAEFTHAPVSRARRVASLVLFSVESGVLCGAVAYAIGTPFYSLISLTAGLFLSVAFGAVAGLVCLPIVVCSLMNRDPEVGKPIVLWCGAVITGVAALVLSESQLVVLIGVAVPGFALSCLLAWRVMPKVWDMPGCCRRCGYDVRASMQFGRCPECGASLDEERFLLSFRRRAADSTINGLLARIAYPLVRFPQLPIVIFVACLLVPAHIQSSRRAQRERSILDLISTADAIDRAFDLSQATPFDWQSVYIFGPYTTRKTITETLGFSCARLDMRVDWVDEGENLAVFVRDGEIVEWAHLYWYRDDAGFDRVGRFQGFDAECLGRPILRADARFRIVQSADDSRRIMLDQSEDNATSPAP